MGKREPVALLHSSSWCLVTVEWLFLGMQQGCLWFVIVVFPDHTHLLFTVYQLLVDMWSCASSSLASLNYDFGIFVLIIHSN